MAVWILVCILDDDRLVEYRPLQLLFSFYHRCLDILTTMTDYDALAHIAEEIQEPETKAPWSIAIATGFSWIGGWLFSIVLAYTMGDPLDKLNSPVVQPVAQIFYEVMGRGGGLFFTVAAYLVLSFGAMAAIQAGSRTIWAFSRDEMLPLSRVWYKIDRRTDTPVYAVWLLTVCCLLINLVALGSYTAIAAIFNLTAIALDWSFCIPIICKLSFGKFKRGPFHLGWASTPINCWAIVWTFFVTIIYVQPTILPVTAQNVSTAQFLPSPFLLTLLPPPFTLSPKLMHQSSDELRLRPHGRSCYLRNRLLVCRRPVLLHRPQGAHTVPRRC